MRKLVLTATAALVLAVAATALAGPITLEQAKSAAAAAAKRDRAKWAVPSQTRLKGPRCNRVDELAVRCTYIVSGPIRKRNNPRGIKRSCTRKLSVTLPDGAERPAVKRIESFCGTVTPPS